MPPEAGAIGPLLAIAPLVALQYFGSYWGHSRHCSVMARNASVANDPIQTSAQMKSERASPQMLAILPAETDVIALPRL